MKPHKSKRELALLVAQAIAEALHPARTVLVSIEGHIRDGRGRNWDVDKPAPSQAHRRAIDSVRDMYDLE